MSKLVRVGMKFPADLLLRLQDHARRNKTSISRLCREAAIREIEAAERTVSNPRPEGE